MDSFALWIQPVQKEEGLLKDGRTAKSEYQFHRLFSAKLLQIYPMPRSEITIFPITTTYPIPPFGPQCCNCYYYAQDIVLPLMVPLYLSISL